MPAQQDWPSSAENWPSAPHASPYLVPGVGWIRAVELRRFCLLDDVEECMGGRAGIEVTPGTYSSREGSSAIGRLTGAGSGMAGV